MKKLIIKLINFYQRYLTLFSFGSCRYYPTCSSYAKMQFEHNSLLKALYFSTIRIVKCNPLFDGGFDYVRVKTPKKNEINKSFTKIKVKYWKVPIDDKISLLVLHNKQWDK
jgi:putative membrane protein insertion efficiency factor